MSGLNAVVEAIILIFYTIYTYLEVIYRFIVPKPQKSLKNDVILITGSGRGIGREMCLQLANSGAKIVCWSRTKGPNDEVVKEVNALGGKAYGFTIDVADRQQVRDLAAKVRKEIGEVTMLINNAGILEVKSFLETTQKEIENIYNINVFSNFWTIKEFLPGMIERRKGHIVCICSASGILPTAYISAYASSKFAVNGFMESLREEMRVHPKRPDIKFTTSYPFFITTEMIEGVETHLRFPFLIPKLAPNECAKHILDGVRRDEEYIYTPWIVKIMTVASWLMPLKTSKAHTDFLQIYIRPTKTNKNK